MNHMNVIRYYKRLTQNCVQKIGNIQIRYETNVPLCDRSALLRPSPSLIVTLVVIQTYFKLYVYWILTKNVHFNKNIIKFLNDDNDRFTVATARPRCAANNTICP